MHLGDTARSLAFSVVACGDREVSEIRPQASVYLLCIWPFFISYH